MELKKSHELPVDNDACCRDTGSASAPEHASSGHGQWLQQKSFWQVTTVCGAAIIIFLLFFNVDISARGKVNRQKVVVSDSPVVTAGQLDAVDAAALAAVVLPADGVTLPVELGNLGKRLVDEGVIDLAQFSALYAGRGGLSDLEREILTGTARGPLVINAQNSGFLLNLLWAFGLGNENKILTEGPMAQKGLEGAGRFASTGGWTLAVGSPMDHYSQHAFLTLTSEQQQLVERVAQNIYRPCCGNSTYFPDCNHGMAMLGLLELMAGQGVEEAQMYRAALAVNSFWFPETYLNIAKLMAKQGQSWESIDPRLPLAAEYSSAAGYRQVVSQIEPVQQQGGGGCGV